MVEKRERMFPECREPNNSTRLPPHNFNKDSLINVQNSPSAKPWSPNQYQNDSGHAIVIETKVPLELGFANLPMSKVTTNRVP